MAIYEEKSQTFVTYSCHRQSSTYTPFTGILHRHSSHTLSSQTFATHSHHRHSSQAFVTQYLHDISQTHSWHKHSSHTLLTLLSKTLAIHSLHSSQTLVTLFRHTVSSHPLVTHSRTHFRTLSPHTFPKHTSHTALSSHTLCKDTFHRHIQRHIMEQFVQFWPPGVKL